MEKDVQSIGKLFQQFAMNFIEVQKKKEKYEQLESVLEKDSVYFMDGAGERHSFI